MAKGAVPTPDDAPHGVSLARYAAVVAALAEPFPKGRVLAVEEIDPAAFRAAEVVWKKRVVRGALFARYAVDLAAAEDWLHRRVSPLHEDAEAWGAFLAAYTARPAEVLRGTGLGPNDFSRLSRHWARLMAQDPGLESIVTRRLAEGPVGLPEITAEPRRLRRSRGTPAGGAAAPVSSPAPAAVPSRASQPVFLTEAEPPLTPVRVVVPSFMAAASFDPAPRDPRGDTSASAPPLAAVDPRAPAPEDATLSFPAFPSGPVLPFAPREAASHRTQALPAIDERTMRPVLPFAGADTPPPSHKAPPPAPAVRPDSPPPSRRASSTLPFARPDIPPPSHKPPPRAPAVRPDNPPPSIPAARAPAVRQGPLSLEQYASLTVELQQSPERADEIERRYGLTMTTRVALDGEYAGRFARDPALYRAFTDACTRYREWLAQASRRR